jgi:hypothetical protein
VTQTVTSEEFEFWEPFLIGLGTLLIIAVSLLIAVVTQ